MIKALALAGLAAVATDTKEAAPTAEVEEPGLDSEVSEQPTEDPTHSRYLPPTHSFHLQVDKRAREIARDTRCLRRGPHDGC